MNGDLMLLHQTAAAFELWTGKKVDLEMLTAKLEEVRGGGPSGAAASAPPTESAAASAPDPSAAQPDAAEPAQPAE
jgi:hypothetical protein